MLDVEKYKGWHFIDTDDFSKLFLMGRETGGCLNVDGGVNRKYLIGNLADGKIRLFGIENQRGEVVARCITRLLWDDTGAKPLLLLENFYTLNGNRDLLQRELLELAKGRAKELKLPLITCKDSLSLKSQVHVPPLKIFDREVKSLSTNGPYEYVDIFHLIYSDESAKSDGVYSVPANSCVILYDPEEKRDQMSSPSLVLDELKD